MDTDSRELLSFYRRPRPAADTTEDPHTAQVLAEVVQTGPHAAMELQYTCHDGSAASIPLEFAAAETSKGDALAVLHAMWCALADNPASVGTHVSYFAFALIKAFQDHP